MNCDKCGGCVEMTTCFEWTPWFDSTTYAFIPAIHCLNCGKYWFKEKGKPVAGEPKKRKPVDRVLASQEAGRYVLHVSITALDSLDKYDTIKEDKKTC